MEMAAWLGVENSATIIAGILSQGGIPADVYGNPVVTDVIMPHVWVKLTVMGTEFALDPSYKTYQTTAGIDLAGVMGYDRNSFLTSAADGMTSTADYVQNPNRGNIRANLNTYCQNLISYVETNNPGATLQEVIGGRRIIRQTDLPMLSTLPYEVSRDEEWTDIPDTYETLVQIQHMGINLILAVPEFYGKRLSLVYIYADGQYYPTLALDGYIIDQGPGSTEIGYHACNLFVDMPYSNGFGDDAGTVYPYLPYFYYISSGWGDVGRDIIETHRRTLEQAVTDGYTDTSEGVLCENLAMIGLSWMAEVTRATQLGDEIMGTRTFQHYELGIVGQQDAPFMDMPMGVTTMVPLDDNENTKTGRFYSRSGINSGFEWGAIDQLQPISAICTIKLLDIACQNGNKIFDAKAANYDPGIRNQLVGYTANALNNVDYFINNGATLVLPEHGNLNEDDYYGTGFIAQYPGGGMGNVIVGGLYGGYGSSSQWADPERARREMKKEDHPEDHSKSKEPIDLTTGYYTEVIADISVGGATEPFGLSFFRTYNSGSRYTDGPHGYGLDA